MHISSSSLLPLLCLLAALIGTSSGLNCFSCGTDGVTSCDEANMVEETCPAGVEYCLRVTLNGEVTRSCAYDMVNDHPKNGEGCKSFATTEKCYCKGNLCNNGGGRLQLTGALLILLLPLRLLLA